MRELLFILSQQPSACAQLLGSITYRNFSGTANFHQTSRGILLLVQVQCLPFEVQACQGPTFFGFHLHEGPSCTGTATRPFADVGGHYNPFNCIHPRHAGDLPPLINNNGMALMMFLVSNFTLEEVIGRTLVIHSEPDDFTTQPTGGAGEVIACGMITQNGCMVP